MLSKDIQIFNAVLSLLCSSGGVSQLPPHVVGGRWFLGGCRASTITVKQSVCVIVNGDDFHQLEEATANRD